MIRSFVAIPLPEHARSALISVQGGLPHGRPVPPENMHITLAFLGEQPRGVIEDLHYSLESLTLPACDIAITAVNVFGDKKPRILYADITRNAGLMHWHQKITNAARNCGIPIAHSRYHPHITLARFGSGLRGAAAAEIRAFCAARAGFYLPSFPVDRFALFQSKLGRSGAVYEMLAQYPPG